MNAAMKRVILAIYLDVSQTSPSGPPWRIIPTFYSNLNIEKGNCKQRKAIRNRLINFLFIEVHGMVLEQALARSASISYSPSVVENTFIPYQANV